MRVLVKVVLDVDPEAWALEYGIERSEVRGDVQTYFADFCRGQLEHVGLQTKSGNAVIPALLRRQAD